MKIENFTFLEHDETMSKWRWMSVKQIGFKPCPRSGISCTVIPNTNKILFFGGVQDIQDDTEDSDDEDDDEHGNFFNDLYSVHVENERATWSKIGKNRFIYNFSLSAKI